MMLASLVMSAWLMGLAGLPHCVVMCAAPCAAARPLGVSWSVVVGRSLGYAALGAVAAAATSALTTWAAWAAKLQPLWVMGLAATAFLGFWMLSSGRLPAWLLKQAATVNDPSRLIEGTRGVSVGVSVMSGMAWAALPCGLLYSAIVVAMLAPDALQGAMVMLAFSLPGGVMLKCLPNFWQRIQVRRPAWLMQWVTPQSAIRLSGGMLATAASWALVHRLVTQWQVWCA